VLSQPWQLRQVGFVLSRVALLGGFAKILKLSTTVQSLLALAILGNETQNRKYTICAESTQSGQGKYSGIITGYNGRHIYQKIIVVMKHSNLYLGLVLPSGG